MDKNLVLEEQPVLLLEIRIVHTRIEVCVVAVRATIFVDILDIFRGHGAYRSTA
jgi:hypothetical protein